MNKKILLLNILLLAGYIAYGQKADTTSTTKQADAATT